MQMNKTRLYSILIAVAVIVVGSCIAVGVYTSVKREENPFSPEGLVEEYGIVLREEGTIGAMNNAVLKKNVTRFIEDENAADYFNSKCSLFRSEVTLSLEELYIFNIFGDVDPYLELEEARGRTFSLSFDGDWLTITDVFPKTGVATYG